MIKPESFFYLDISIKAPNNNSMKFLGWQVSVPGTFLIRFLVSFFWDYSYFSAIFSDHYGIFVFSSQIIDKIVGPFQIEYFRMQAEY